MLSTSEYVTSGHPDRLADNIAAAIIHEINKNDRENGHAAVEVFLTHNKCIVSGEVTTTLDLTGDTLNDLIKTAYLRSGYLSGIRNYWTKDQCVLFEDVEVVNELQSQSPDIALGTTSRKEDSGWNDQNVSFSSSDNQHSNKIGTPMNIAMFIGESLKELSAESLTKSEGMHFGPDIKVLVTCDCDDVDGMVARSITAITVAIPHEDIYDISLVRKTVLEFIQQKLDGEFASLSREGCEFVINGTGKFTVFGQVSDTSMTGRKISVNHPSAGPIYSNKMIGGGSLIKCWHASDLLLNVYARYIANTVVEAGLSTYAVVGTSGAIGQTKMQSIFIYGDSMFNSNFREKVTKYFMEKKASPITLAKKFDLFGDGGFDFGICVNKNLFGYKDFQPWECVTEEVDSLMEYLHH